MPGTDFLKVAGASLLNCWFQHRLRLLTPLELTVEPVMVLCAWTLQGLVTPVTQERQRPMSAAGAVSVAGGLLWLLGL